MRTLDFALPGPIGRRTGGTIYDRRIVEGLRARGWHVRVHELGGAHPMADAAAVGAAEAALAAAGRPLVIDGLALPAFRLAARGSRDAGIVALVHHPLAEEAGLAPEIADALRLGERADLARVGGAIVTSGFTRGVLIRDFAVPADRVIAVPPGVDPAGGRGRPTSPPGPVRMLSIAALVPRKGHRHLIEALQPLARSSWYLTCIGSDRRDPSVTNDIRNLLQDSRLEEKVELLGEVDDASVGRHLAAADLFVHAAVYEGYGMAVAEALRAGVPVVAVAGGAIPEVVPPEAGLLCPPGDVAALTRALAAVIDDPDRRRALAAGAAAAGALLPDWQSAADRFAEALGRLVP
ncbi:MAG: glycosyltransferase family 4 protein [Alphaproteobacteria bacterium]